MNVHAVDKSLNYLSNDYTTYYPLIPPGPLAYVFFIRIQVRLSIAGRGRRPRHPQGEAGGPRKILGRWDRTGLRWVQSQIIGANWVNY